MSILIKGMTVPQNCVECRFLQLFRTSESTQSFCVAIGKTFQAKETYSRREDCPLIELQPHGDLIDRDALNNAFTGMRFDADGFLLNYGDREDWYLKGSEVETLITNATTIIEAEEIKDG